MNLKLTTFANYSGNSKLAEASKTLKYGDLEIRLINDVYYFVHDNGATIEVVYRWRNLGQAHPSPSFSSNEGARSQRFNFYMLLDVVA